MELPDTVRELLTNIDAKRTCRSIPEVFDALNKLVGVRELDASLVPVQWELMAFGFHSPHLKGIDPRQEFFRPSMSGATEDGTILSFPDKSLIVEATVGYWATRAAESKSPLLRARYADLAWHFAPQVAWPGNRADFARIAIVSYLELAKGLHLHHGTGAYDDIHRALHLAILICDPLLVAEARDLLLDAERRLAVTSQLGTWGMSYETLLESKRVELTQQQSDQIIADLEQHLAESADTEHGAQSGPFAAQQAARLLARHYRRAGRANDVCRVLSRYRDAFLEFVRKGPALTAVGQLNWVYHDFKDFGVEDGMEDLEATIRTYGELARHELGVFSHEVQLSEQQVEDQLGRIVVDSLEKSCVLIARTFIPDVAEARKTVGAIRDNSPLYALTPISTMTPDGRSEASVGGTENDPDGRLVQHISQAAQFTSAWLDLTMQRLFAQFGDTAHKFLEYLVGCPLYRDSDLITLTSALQAYLRREYVLSVSALIPVAESAIRRLAQVLGASIMKRARTGGQYLRNLDELLLDEKVSGFLKEDMSLYLRTILTDQRGWNMRNNVCHGVIPGDQILLSYANRVLHNLLVIALLRAKDPQGAASS